MSCTWCCVVHPVKTSELAPHLVLQLLFFKTYFKCNVWSKRGDRRTEYCCQGLDKTSAKSTSGFFNSQQIFLKFVVVMTF